MAKKKPSLFSGLLRLLMALAAIYFLITAIVVTFRRTDGDDTAILKTLGFWGVCVVILVLDMVYIGLTNTKKHSSVITVNLIGVAICWVIYGLMF